MTLFILLLLTAFKRCNRISVAETNSSLKNIYNIVFIDWAQEQEG